MKPVIHTPRAEVYCAGFEDVAPTLAEVDAPQESDYQRNQRIMLETAARTIAELEAANG